MKHMFALILLFTSINAFSQSYTSYFTGSSTDLVTIPDGGTCMMGGASEHDGAMSWFLERANGGDVLVLRASGSDGYNDYMFTDLAVTVNSVETIVFNNASAANETYIQNKIKNAEAIWFAGGDQWDYISYWRDSPIDSLINVALEERNIVIGGTSAGMAILGNYYFSASNGTVTSADALSNPYNTDMTVDSTDFLNINYLTNVITDSHYDDPDRKGRHVVFLARILTDYGVQAKGIACNEYTSVCVDQNGLAKVFGDYPAYPETAYFLQTNCELEVNDPENCSDGNPLNWNLNGKSVRVYKVNGTNTGTNTFSLNDWSTGSGGTWENWSVDNGTFTESAGLALDCSTLANSDYKDIDTKIFPNPFVTDFYIESNTKIQSYTLTDANGKLISNKKNLNQNSIRINNESLPKGIYFIKVLTENGLTDHKALKI
jgi:cyanophycinase-like exopeptidase